MCAGSKCHRNNSVKSKRGNKNIRSSYVPKAALRCPISSDEIKNDRVNKKS